MIVRIGGVDVRLDGYVHIDEQIPHHKHPTDPSCIILDEKCPLDIYWEDGDVWVERND